MSDSDTDASDVRQARTDELSGGRVVIHLDGENAEGDKTAWVIGVPMDVNP